MREKYHKILVVDDDLRVCEFLEKAIQDKYSFNQLLKEYIKKMMIETGGHKTKVSEILGIDRKTLYRKLKEL
jgi:DNA-binding NtrC family response regulator